MLHSPWLRRLTAPRRGRAAAPRLEQLEDRCVLATLVGVTSAGNLVRFDSATPGTLTTIGAVSGLGTGQSLVAIDFRPATGELYGMGFLNGTGQLYKINPTTAAASALGNPFSTKLTGTRFEIAFDPVADKLRVVSNAGENLRVDPASGSLAGLDSSINPGDVVVGIAYDHNFKGATTTTLYGYDTTTNKLVTIGSVGGSPNSANTGTLSAVGSTGVTAQLPGLGFDIDADGTAYLNVVVGGTSGLYTANLTTGALTSVGSFGVTMLDITAAPAASFSVTGFPPQRTAGLSGTVTVTARNVYGLTATGYAGTVAFTSSDPKASLPANATLTKGTGTFAVAFNTPGTQSVTATDTVRTDITGSQQNITVLPNSEVVGLTAAGSLVRFNAATPGSLTTIGAVSGLAAGQSLVAIDFRPKTGELYGMGFASGTGQLYKINPTTAAATAVGAPFSKTLSGLSWDIAFDPVADVLRVTSDANENLRVSPTTGALVASDTLLTPTTANVVGIAYDRNFVGATATTLYGYDVSTDNLVTIGNVNGTPNSPNGGQVMKVGPSNVTTTAGTSANVGLDIDANGGAYLALVSGGASKFYTVDLAGGGAALNGAFPGGVTMRDITVAPAVKLAFARVAAPHVAGASSPVEVFAVDAFGNVAAGYHGTVHFTSSDPAAVLPADTTLTGGDGVVNVTFKTPGTVSLTATDTVNAAITGTANVTVVAAADIVGLTTAGQLVHFSSAAPGTVTVVGTIGGVTSGQSLVGLDFRPATGELYALGFGSGAAQLYKINPTTASATAVGTSFTLSAGDKSFGFGFDPVADVARITSSTGENVRVSPITGAVVSNDTALSPSSLYAGVAYDRNVRGATQTTLYSYDLTNNQLVTIGSVNGSPNSPNSGKVSAVGASTVTADSGTADRAGFDVGGDGVGYLNLVVNGTSGLYTANLGTGALSQVGNFGGVTLVGLSEAMATALTVSGFPSPIARNTPGTFTVTAVDPYGVTVPSYSGTVTFTSTDPKATLPADSPLTNGTGRFTATFATVGTQNLTASDAAVPTITGTQSGIIVNLHGTAAGPVSRIGVVRGAPDRVATLSLDTNGDGTFDSGDAVFTFGLSSDKFIVGDWAGNGFDSVGVVRPTSSGVAQFSLDTNGDNVFDAGDQVFSFGLNSDTFIVGDWNGSGTTKIGVVRPGSNGVPVFSLDTNGDGVFDAGDTVTSFGLNGDRFVVGDWNGDGRSKIGIVRPTSSGVLVWVLDTNGDGVFDVGDAVLFFGLNGDTPVVGDWNGTGTSKIGVVRGRADGSAVWTLDTNGDGVFDAGDSILNFGLATDRFLVGRWQQPSQLVAADGALDAEAPPLALDANFVAVANQAIAAWQQAGLDPQHVALLQNIHYAVAPLGNAALGESLGNNITLDPTAAGHGWSETPSPQPGKMDLFTVLSHEMGHTLGLGEGTTDQQSDVMFESLLPGVRKAPTPEDVDALFAARAR
jgi:hypothetical protein